MGIDIFIAMGVVGAMMVGDSFVSRRQLVFFALGSLVISPVGAMGLLLAARERTIAQAFVKWADGGHVGESFTSSSPGLASRLGRDECVGRAY